MAAYDLFIEEVSKSTAYIVSTLEPNVFFKATHANAEEREKWCRGSYNVKFDQTTGSYICECGLHSHFGMLCCHAISVSFLASFWSVICCLPDQLSCNAYLFVMQVMTHLGVTKIPDQQISLRWTKKARDNVPPYVEKACPNGGNVNAKRFRHNVLHSASNEIVRIGENDHESFQVVLRHIAAAKKELATYESTKQAALQTTEVQHSFAGQASNVIYTDIEYSNTGELQVYDRESDTDINVSAIKPPNPRIHCGRPSNRRYHSRLEGRVCRVQQPSNTQTKKANTSGSVVRKPRLCHTCRRPDHDSRKCPENTHALRNQITHPGAQWSDSDC